MFTLKQFLKALVLPPVCWILLLVLVLIFWNRKWARKALLATIVLILLIHSGRAAYFPFYFLGSRYPALVDPSRVGPYDGIVVVTEGMVPPGGMMPFPTISAATFHRLDEAWRLYRLAPKPIIVSGGHVDPFTPAQEENKIACDYLRLWGVQSEHVIPEPNSRDTFEGAVAVKKILDQRGWRRYLLVTSAYGMPRSMLVFRAVAPEPIPAPALLPRGAGSLSPLSFFPTEGAATTVYITLHEYLGLINYTWRSRTFAR